MGQKQNKYINKKQADRKCPQIDPTLLKKEM